MPIIVNLTGVGESKAAEAFAAGMAAIGVNVKIIVPANTNELFSTYMKYPAMMFDYGTPVQTAYARGNDWLVVLFRGEVVETGATEDLYQRPAHPYTRRLLSAVHLHEEESTAV